MDLDLAGLLGMRLSEHALHTWDVAVALDERAVVAADAVDILIDSLGPLAGRAGRPDGRGTVVEVVTTEPERRLVLDIGGDQVTLTAGAPGATATMARLHLPAEALVRLVYGRLDAAHTPPVTADGIDLGIALSVNFLNLGSIMISVMLSQASSSFRVNDLGINIGVSDTRNSMAPL